MTVELIYYGHACFGINGAGARILIDPFLSGNPDTTVSSRDVSADYILVSHAHGDHLGDTVEVARRTGAMVVSNFEIASYCEKQDCKVHPLHIGGSWAFPFGRVKLTIAHHGSSFPDGSYGGNPAGFLLYIDGKRIYHAGDTGLFYDMKLIGEEGIDVAILPIGDNFTMGPEDALRAIKLIQPRVVIPIHYKAFDLIRQDPKTFAYMVKKETTTQCVILDPGDRYVL